MIKSIESGRTLAETLGVLGIMTLLAVSAIKGYHFLTAGVKAQNTAKMIKTLVFERQNAAVADSSSERTVKGPHSSLIIKNGTPGNHQPYFWVETTLSDSDFCERLKESGFIQADLIEVDGVENGNCRDNSKIAFYFKKDAIANVYCPSHSTNCDTYGDATGCEMGYYLNGGKCSACGEHVATCEDEYTATSCKEGYLLFDKACITTTCTTDEDCHTVCAVCDNGSCRGECELPEPDANDDCGENECMVYDNATQSCKYACERKEYLESTGTQYIDTGIIATENTRVLAGFYTTQTGNKNWFGGNITGIAGSARGFCFNAFNTASVEWVFGNSGWETANVSNVVNKYFELDFSKSDILINGVNIATPSYSNFAQQTSSLLIFARSGGGGKINGRVYYFKMYNASTLVRDMIPVLSPTESEYAGKACMFDRVSKKLFCGVGTFDYGPK